MNEITTAITEIKTKISLDKWRQRIIDCQHFRSRTGDYPLMDNITAVLVSRGVF